MIEAIAVLMSLSGAPPPYVYQDRTLELRPQGLSASKQVKVRWRGLSHDGKIGRRDRRISAEADERGRVVLDVDVAGGHEVTLRFGAEHRRVIATRGTWFVFPRANQWDLSRTSRAEGLASVLPTDIVIAGAFGAKVATVRRSSPPQIGRTLGMDMGASIQVSSKQVLVLVASSTQQGVIVTITEPRADGTHRYWDLPLNMTPQPKRYVVPFRAFMPRDSETGTLRRLGAIAFRTNAAARVGDHIHVDVVGLDHRRPRIERVRRRKKGFDIRLSDVTKNSRTVVNFRGVETSTSVLARGAVVRVRGPVLAAMTDVWLSTRRDGVESTDPPDAPVAAYLLPSRSGDALVVDDFKGATLLNAQRRRTHVYTSTIGFDASRFSSRVAGRIRLEDPDRLGLEYVGYETPIPRSVPTDLEKLEVQVRGRGPSSQVRIGVRGRDGVEPKLVLPIPLDGQWRSAVVLLEKYGPRSKFDSVTVTLLADPKVAQWIEVRRVSLLP